MLSYWGSTLKSSASFLPEPGFCLTVCWEMLLFCCTRSPTLLLSKLYLHSRHGRVEELSDNFEVVTSRAFSSLADFCVLSQQALAPRGVWLAMKGKRPDGEIAALPSNVEVFHVEQLEVPGLDAERCLVWMRRAGEQEC